MPRNTRKATHTAYDLRVHLVWITKYRYKVLTHDVGHRTRELIRQFCSQNDIYILKGVVSKEHMHLYVSYPPTWSISEMMKRIKGMSSRKLQQEFPNLGKQYWGKHFWAVGYGAFSSGEVTDNIIKNYLENHDTKNDSDDGFVVE